ADLDIGEPEGSGVAVPRPPRAPGGPGAACQVFDLIQGVLHEGLEAGSAGDMFTAERVTGRDAEDRLHLQILAPLQELHQPEAVGGAVAPRTLVARPLLDRPDRLFPVEPLRDGVAFEVVTAG